MNKLYTKEHFSLLKKHHSTYIQIWFINQSLFYLKISQTYEHLNLDLNFQTFRSTIFIGFEDHLMIILSLFDLNKFKEFFFERIQDNDLNRLLALGLLDFQDRHPNIQRSLPSSIWFVFNDMHMMFITLWQLFSLDQCKVRKSSLIILVFLNIFS